MSVTRAVGCAGLFAVKPAPTGSTAHRKAVYGHKSLVAVCQSPEMLDVPASSLASQLLQVRIAQESCVRPQSHCRSWLASDGGQR
ncbi:hypothetical protein EMIT0P218_240001 [Pseudomonas sp. IT-P218]